MSRHANVRTVFLLSFSQHRFSSFFCDCAINEGTRELVRSTIYAYQARTNQLIDSGVYDTDDTFTVVRQPFMEHMTVPTTVNPHARKLAIKFYSLF